jgi:membrane protein
MSASPEQQVSAEGLRTAALQARAKRIAERAEAERANHRLAVGVPVLLYVTRSLLRGLIGAHRLVWTDLRAAAPRPTAKATLRLLALILCLFVLSGAAASARAHSFGLGLLASLLLVVSVTGLWLLISIRLPHRDADWMSLLPGAIAFAVGVEVPEALSKQGSHGALGLAAALLFALYLVSRLVVGAAVLNATLWERRSR